jgi:hypothetical protein
MKRLFGMLMILFFLFGCAGVKTQAPVAVCQEFPGDSLIEKYIPDLRTANTLIKLSIYEVSKLSKVKKEDIVKFLDEADALASKTTYNEMALYLMAKVKWIKENMGRKSLSLVMIWQHFKTSICPSPRGIGATSNIRSRRIAPRFCPGSNDQ